MNAFYAIALSNGLVGLVFVVATLFRWFPGHYIVPGTAATVWLISMLICMAVRRAQRGGRDE
jgi:hypothetical protein